MVSSGCGTLYLYGGMAALGRGLVSLSDGVAVSCDGVSSLSRGLVYSCIGMGTLGGGMLTLPKIAWIHYLFVMRFDLYFLKSSISKF